MTLRLRPFHLSGATVPSPFSRAFLYRAGLVVRLSSDPPRSFYRRPPVEVAPELLNKLLVRDDGRAGRIVEVEAYAGSVDPAAHSYRGQTPRTASMFGEAGHLYVYFTYGMHWGSNVVCGDVGEGVAVLLRAIEPLLGLERMRELRPAARRDHDLASGPGKLSQAFGLDRSFDGADLVTGNHGIVIASDGVPPPEDPVVGPASASPALLISLALAHP